MFKALHMVMKTCLAAASNRGHRVHTIMENKVDATHKVKWPRSMPPLAA
jgi:hypothetical protein